MKSLNIGSITVPINAATKTFAILAKRGAGKTYTGCVMAEEFSKNNIPFVVFDPIDVWWGLRLAANGKDKGLPVVVFGVQHEDIKLDRSMGRKIAQAVVRENVSCIINTFGLSKTDQRHILAEFSEELLNINDTPRHIFIEEAHEFLPQRVFGGLGVVFNAVSNLVVMGRNKGIGVTLINQRAATLNKDVLTQIDTLLAFQNTSPQDRKALADWVEYHSAEGDFKKFMDSLPSLPKGEGWIWSPEFMSVFKKIKIRKRETFHPDREKLGDTFVMPDLDRIDIKGFISKFENSTKEVTEVQVEKKHRSTGVDHVHEDVISINVHEKKVQEIRNTYESDLITKEAEIRRLQNVISQVQMLVGASDSGSLASRPVSSGLSLWQSKLGNGLAGRLLNFFADNAGQKFNREQACLAVGVSPRAGHTKNEVAKLLRTRAVVKEGDMYQLNPNM